MGCPDYPPTKADAMIDAGFVWCEPCRDWIEARDADDMGGGEYLCRPHAESKIAEEEGRRSE